MLVELANSCEGVVAVCHLALDASNSPAIDSFHQVGDGHTVMAGAAVGSRRHLGEIHVWRSGGRSFMRCVRLAVAGMQWAPRQADAGKCYNNHLIQAKTRWLLRIGAGKWKLEGFL